MGKVFNPDGSLRDPDALRSIQFNGAGMTVPRSTVDDAGNKRVETLHDDTGKPVGYHTHHPSGRVDALVNVDPVVVSGDATL